MFDDDFDQSTGTTWNPFDNSTAILSNGNITATFGLQQNTFQSIRSTNPKTSGKFMFVVQIAQLDPIGGWLIGVGSQFASLDTQGGISIESASGIFGAQSKQLLISNGITIRGYTLTSANRDKIGVCIDLDAKLAWWNNLSQKSGWTNSLKSDFSGNPTANIGGTELGFDTSRGTYIFGSGFCYNNDADSLTLNPQCYGYTDIIPDEYQSWDVLTTGFTVAEPC